MPSVRTCDTEKAAIAWKKYFEHIGKTCEIIKTNCNKFLVIRHS